MEIHDFGKEFRTEMGQAKKAAGKAGKALARGIAEQLPMLEKKCRDIGIAFKKSSNDFFAKPKVQKTRIQASLIVGSLKEKAKDISQVTIEKLGVKNKLASQLTDSDGRFKKLREGIQARKATHPDEAEHLSTLDKAVSDAKAKADGAYAKWDKTKAKQAETRAKYREARHQTDLARMDVKIAEERLTKAKEALAINELAFPETQEILTARGKLTANVTNAQSAFNQALLARDARVNDENESRENVEKLSKEEEIGRGDLEKALAGYRAVVTVVKWDTDIDTSTLAERLGAQVGKMRREAGKKLGSVIEKMRPEKMGETAAAVQPEGAQRAIDEAADTDELEGYLTRHEADHDAKKKAIDAYALVQERRDELRRFLEQEPNLSAEERATAVAFIGERIAEAREQFLQIVGQANE